MLVSSRKFPAWQIRGWEILRREPFSCVESVAKLPNNGRGRRITPEARSEMLRMSSVIEDPTPGDISSDVLVRALVEMLLDGVALVSRDGRFLQVTSTFAYVFGYTVDELKDLTIHNLVVESFREKHKELVASYFEEPIQIRLANRPVKVVSKDGTVFPVQIGIIPHGPTTAVVVLKRVIDTELAKSAQIISNLREKYAHDPDMK
jgi:PAS domain S-box-containing protein